MLEKKEYLKNIKDLEIKTTWEQCNSIFDKVKSVNSDLIREDKKKWVSVESMLKELKSVQSEWKYPSREGTFTDPRMMIDSLIKELKKASIKDKKDSEV